MKSTNYKVGMIVAHPKRPEWGPGKVVAVAEERVHVVFRDSLERKAKAIMREVVSLDVCDMQNDAVLDVLPPATEDGGSWILPKNYERVLHRASEAGKKRERQAVKG